MIKKVKKTKGRNFIFMESVLIQDLLQDLRIEIDISQVKKVEPPSI
jgi:hypothetical protein